MVLLVGVRFPVSVLMNIPDEEFSQDDYDRGFEAANEELGNLRDLFCDLGESDSYVAGAMAAFD